MIRAGNHSIDDKGFVVSMERIGGVTRQALVLELPGGISDEALSALCAGPIEVLDESGAVAQTHAGPFQAVSHGLKLVRASSNDDVAALSARVNTLEAALEAANSEKDSAVNQLAILSGRFAELKASMANQTGIIKAGESLAGNADEGLVGKNDTNSL